MKTKLIPIIMLVIIYLTSCTQSSDAVIKQRTQRIESGLLGGYVDPPWQRMSLAERMAHYQVPGVSIAVINDFEIEWAKGYGVMEAGKSQAVTPDSLFQTASIGKVVVAVAAMHFIETGTLDLDRDVNQYLISWKIPDNEFTAKEKVTLRRLLSHSAGVTVEGFRGYAQGEPVPDLLQILNGEPPANSAPIRVDTIPGTQYRYAGGGYVIVQQLFEDVTGNTFPNIMRNTVLKPWGMESSTFDSPLPEQLRNNTASGHRTDGAPITGGWYTYPEMGSGASLWSTPTDMAKFMIKVMQSYEEKSDSVLSKNNAIQMLTPQIDGRGLGPVLGDDGSDLFYFMHPGANDGYKAVMVAYPHRGQGVIIMTNSDNGDALWREILNSVSIEYGWVKNYTAWYVAMAGLIILVLTASFILRRKRVKGKSE